MYDFSILVLESVPVQRQAIVNALGQLMKGAIHAAADGAEALSVLDHFGHIDVVVCDIDIPGMDGLEFLRHASDRGLVSSVIMSGGLDPALHHATISMISCLGLNFLGDIDDPFDPALFTQLMIKHQALRRLPRGAVGDIDTASLNDVKRALDTGQFVAYYQPQVYLDSNLLVGGEALARWNHPRLGVLPPSHFLPLISNYPLIDRLFWQIFEQGLTLQRKLAKQGQPLSMAYNLHASQLGGRHLSERIVSLLKRFQIAASLIVFEVTEVGLIDAPANSLENLVRLRMIGCGLAIDGFGAGRSSLQRLCELPFNQIKLDRSFVEKIPGQPKTFAIISCTVALARALKVSLVVEGVETQEQQQHLLSLGCSYAQGFLFARPMPEGHFIDYCVSEHARLREKNAKI